MKYDNSVLIVISDYVSKPAKNVSDVVSGSEWDPRIFKMKVLPKQSCLQHHFMKLVLEYLAFLLELSDKPNFPTSHRCSVPAVAAPLIVL